MKKFLSFLMAIMMLLSLVACGEKGSDFQQQQNTNGNQQQNTNGNQQQNTNGSQQGNKAPTIDELTAAFINQGFDREPGWEDPLDDEDLAQIGLSKVTLSVSRCFEKSLEDGEDYYVELYYFKCANEADAVQSFYVLVEYWNDCEDYAMVISSGKNGLRATGGFSTVYDGDYTVMLSQVGNTLVFTHWEIDNDEILAILSSLGY